MNLYGRTIRLAFIKHNGRGAIQDQLEVSDSIVSIGNKSWQVGGNDLVRINPSTLSFRLFDQVDSIYNWITSTLPQTDGLVPPFVNLEVDGVTTFYGTVNLDSMKRTRDSKQDYLDFSCQDWSRLLADADMTELVKRSLPQVVSTTGNVRFGKTKAGLSTAKCIVGANYYRGHPEANNVVYFDLDTDWLIPGDRVYCNETLQTYTVEKVWLGSNPQGTSNCYIATLTGFLWPNPPASTLWIFDPSQYSYTFIRQATNCSTTTFLTAKETFVPDQSNAAAKVYTLKVDSVNGVYPGDKVDHLTVKETTSYTIRDINSETNTLVFTEPITVAVSIGDKLQLSPESYEYVLFESFKNIITACALTIGGVLDFSRFTAHTFSRPFLSWLPFRGPAGDVISSPNNIQANLTDITLRGPDLQTWTGTPETGYTKGSSWTETVDWTQHLTTAPSSLMPLEVTTYPEYALRTNKPRWFREWKFGDTNTTWNDSPNGFYIYDYSTMKRYEVKNNKSSATVSNTTYYSDTWNGTAWTARTTLGSGVGSTPLCGVAFPALANTLLVLQRNGSLILEFGAQAGATLAAPAGLENGVLVRTPYGVYLIGQNGAYGKITWTGSALHIDSYIPKVYLPNNQTLKEFRFFETTLTAMSSTQLYILGNIRYIKDSNAAEPEILDEVWLFNLDPDALAPPSIQPEKIADGSYSIARALKDPTSTRLFGILGGRIFQISTKVTDTFERFKPDSSALDLIEHLCIAQNAMALPGDGAVLQILSRNFTEAATVVPLDIKSETTTRTDSFFSLFEVKGVDDDTSWYWLPAGSNDPMHELSTIKRGGKSFELSGGDYVTTTSQCASLAADYADFYGKPRMGRDLEVSYTGQGAAPYETLKPLQRIKINSETTEWHVMSVNYSLADCKANIKLLQAY
jgi:hypothetical protein